MTVNIIKKIATEKAVRFRAAFTTQAEDVFYKEEGGVFHPGEFGMYREDVVKDFLKSFLPTNRQISSGFIVTHTGTVSNQTDIVIYDAVHTPVITDDKKQKFFPIETVCGAGEIKSNPDKKEFIDAVTKLAKVKQMREESCKVVISRDHSLTSKAVDIKEILYDQIYTFLVCKKFNFSVESEGEWSKIFASIEPHLRPNIVFSLEDGIFAYTDENNMFLYYPYAKKRALPIKKGNFKDDEALIFGAYTFAAINSTTIFYPDLVNYLK